MAVGVAQFLGQLLRGVDPVEQPEGVAQLLPQRRRGEGVARLARQGVEPFVDGLVVDKAAMLYAEKLIEVEGKGLLVAVNLDALTHLADDDIRHAVGIHVELRHVGIGVAAAAFVPRPLGAALVGVGPVEDGARRKLLVGQCLERCTAEVKGVAAVYLVEGHIGLVGVDALVGLIDDEQIPVELGHLVEFLDVAAEVDGTLQVLQTDELNAALHGAGLLDAGEVLLTRQTGRHLVVLRAQQGVDAAHEEVAVLTDKLQIILIPRVGDGGAVGHHEHVVQPHAQAEVVHGEGLAEAWFSVPEKFGLGVVGEAADGLTDSLLLAIAQLIALYGPALDDAAVLPELEETVVGGFGANMEPFGMVVALDAELGEIGMEVGVVEGLGAALVNGVAVPFDVPGDACGMALLPHTVLDALPFGVANLHPAAVLGNLGGGVGVDLWQGHVGGMDVRCVHRRSALVNDKNSQSI